ncbi:MAG: ABC transporter permease [Firmicutes bacterium]|nr:ABC transporter permease [Bacillota bacterium]
MTEEKINVQSEDTQSLSKNIKKLLFDNMVTIMFLILGILGVIFSELPIFFIVNELLTRLARNSFLVLALIIPVLAGMGLNFAITVGAMAGQAAILMVVHWKIPGIYGFILAWILTIPIAIILGILTGKLLNKTKGQEMIASLITGYFANGIYQFIFLFGIGTFIPMTNKVLILGDGVGIRNTVDLARNNGIKYSIDNLAKFPLFPVLIVAGILLALFSIYQLTKNEEKLIVKVYRPKYFAFLGLSALLIIMGLLFTFNIGIPINLQPLRMLKIPLATLGLVALSGVFHILIVKTKLGQKFRTVGQDKHIASVSGINVNKIRVIAITISTVLAGWGQIIFLQNMGIMNTYGSHVQIALFSIAAILIGGASVTKATVGQAILGVILFHTLFIVSPRAAQNIFGDAQIGEFFRNFISYGVIGVALGLYAWKKRFNKTA